MIARESSVLRPLVFMAAVLMWLASDSRSISAEGQLDAKQVLDLAILRADRKDDFHIYTSRDWRDNLYLYLRNPSPQPLDFKESYIQGVRLPIPPSGNPAEISGIIKETNVLWADLCPNPIPPGAWAELKVRYYRQSGIRDQVSVKLVSKGGTAIEGHVRVSHESPIRFTSYCFDKGMKKLWVYIRAEQGVAVKKVFLDGVDLTERTVIRDVDGSFRLLVISLQEAVPWGDYRVVKVSTNRGAGACLVKAIDPFFFISMWCVCKANRGAAPEEWLADCTDHHVNAVGSGFLHREGAENDLPLLDKHKLKFSGNRWGNIKGWGSVEQRAKKLGNDRRLVFWEVLDEPGWKCSDTLPMAVMNLWMLPYRRHARQPTYVSHAAYGVIAGHAYGNGHFVYRDTDFADMAALFRYPVPNDPLHPIENEMDALRLAVGPKPVSFIPQAFSWNPDSRWPTPDEERLMVYMAVAHGAKGMFYFCYGPWNGGAWPGVGVNKAPEAQKLWAEIKQINVELTVLGDLLLKGEPVPLARSDQQKLEVASILSGQQAIVVLAINHDYASDKKQFVPHPLKGVEIEVEVPTWFEPKDVFAVSHKGLKKIDHRQAPGKLLLSLDEVRTVRTVVISNEANLLEEMRMKFSAIVKE